MAIKIPKNEEVSAGKNNEGEKGVGLAICRRRATRRSVNVKEREREKVI